MRKLESPRQWLTTLAFGRGIDEHALQVECSRLLLLVGRDLHRKQTVAWSVVLVERGVAASNDDLAALVSFGSDNILHITVCDNGTRCAC